jgi:hypothetical protein
MSLATFVLFLLSGYVAGKLFILTNTRGRLKFLGLTVAAAIFTIMQLFLFIDMMVENPDLTAATEFIAEWGHITCLAFILSSLAVFIRESKPVFAQFPLLYTALPLLILISYFLVRDTYALKSWLTAIYQGGAIIVSLLMYSVYSYRRTEYIIILLGIIVFLITYIVYWHIPGIQESYAWIWKLLLGIAMVVTVLGYEQNETQLAA